METLNVEWVLDGLRMLVLADKRLLLYQHKSLATPFTINGDTTEKYQNGQGASYHGNSASNTYVHFSLSPPHEDATTTDEEAWPPSADESACWRLVWRVELAAIVKHIKFAPDGTRFATCGEEDRFVKIWYQEKGGH